MVIAAHINQLLHIQFLQVPYSSLQVPYR